MMALIAALMLSTAAGYSSPRAPVVAGNWKMNMTIAEAVELVNGIQIGLKWPEEVDVVVAPPFTALKMISEVSRLVNLSSVW